MKSKNVIFFVVVFVTSCFFANNAKAQDFVYKPINTSFGGDQLNYSWMLNSATQQNRIEDESEDGAFSQPDPLDDFKSNLNRQILNELSRRLVDEIFGNGGELETGTFQLGDFNVDIFEDAGGVNVNIQDITNGNFTNVQIPNP